MNTSKAKDIRMKAINKLSKRLDNQSNCNDVNGDNDTSKVVAGSS